MKVLTQEEQTLIASGMVKVGVNPDSWAPASGEAVQSIVQQFNAQHPRYLGTKQNRKLILEWLTENGLVISPESLHQAYEVLHDKLDLEQVPLAARIISLADAPQAHVSRVDFETGAVTETEPTSAFSSANARHTRNRLQLQAERERQIAAKFRGGR